MKVLSLFDGMSGGYLALMKLGIPVDEYHAYEIDPQAIALTEHNIPLIQEHGDVFSADFTQYSDIDMLVGGSPCTFWSCAQKKEVRETTPDGIGWTLFQEYVRALREARPKMFLFENNGSISNTIKSAITKEFISIGLDMDEWEVIEE